jgi:hypothetical protein
VIALRDRGQRPRLQQRPPAAATTCLILNHRPATRQGRGCGVGRILGGGLGLGVGVGRIVAVGVAVGVGLGLGGGVTVAVAVALGVGVGVPPPPSPGAWISTVIGEPVLKYPTVALAVCGG